MRPAGLNEWPASGADDMFFHAGFAARNAVTAVELAELGAFASETALDGPAGLFAALRQSDRVSDRHAVFRRTLEIFSVYHKPAPACNYAQTACQAALAIGMRQCSEITAVRSEVLGRGDQLSGLQRSGSVRARPASQDEHPLLRRGDTGSTVDRGEQLPAVSTIRRSRG